MFSNNSSYFCNYLEACLYYQLQVLPAVTLFLFIVLLIYLFCNYFSVSWLFSTLDIDYPKVPNSENFFVSAVSRTIVSLIARTPVQEPLKKRPALSARDLLVTETPTRPLSDIDQGELYLYNDNPGIIL